MMPPSTRRPAAQRRRPAPTRRTLGVDVVELTPQPAQAVAAEAFVFGYPLVLMDVTRALFTTPSPTPGPGPAAGAPANQLTHLRAFPEPAFLAVVSPNADTLYSIAWLDLAAEPIVLTTPPSAGRYHLLPLLSAWTDVFASPGTRTTGDGDGAFAIVGPGFTGQLPPGLQELRSPTSMAWLIGRTQTNGLDDYEQVHRFQDALALTPLSAWGKEKPVGRDPAPPAEPLPPADDVDHDTPPPDQVAAMDAVTFFGRLARLMVDNPPAPADAPALQRFTTIGLRPGSFTPSPEIIDWLDEGIAAGKAQIVAALQRPAASINGWSVFRGLGSYGTDYSKRALVALVGLGANLDEDAIYPHATTDGDGQPLDGEHRYVLRFPPGQTPPARAFWSLTMYNDHQHFYDNFIGRYAIGDRDPLVYGPDGSLEILMQYDQPESPEQQANWLPAPGEPFAVTLRVYWPEQRALDGSWAPPPIRRIE